MEDCREYERDIVACMFARESKLPEVRGRSPQLEKRRQLVDWTCVQCENFGFPKPTTNLAIGKSSPSNFSPTFASKVQAKIEPKWNILFLHIIFEFWIFFIWKRDKNWNWNPCQSPYGPFYGWPYHHGRHQRVYVSRRHLDCRKIRLDRSHSPKEVQHRQAAQQTRSRSASFKVGIP